MPPQTRIHIFPGPAGVAKLAARTLREVCAAKQDSRITVALSGGSTPAILYKLLAEDYLHEIPWGRLEVFFGDERAVPPSHPDSNYRLAWTTLLTKVPVPPEQVHRMPAEDEDWEEAARAYEAEIVSAVPAGPLGEPSFDLVWLGMGEDGHTASLFPGTGALRCLDRFIAPNAVPQLDTRRMTMTFPLLNAARRIQFLVTGKKKAPVLQKILGHGGSLDSTPFPAARVRPADGLLEWLLDREAASGISDEGLIAGIEVSS